MATPRVTRAIAACLVVALATVPGVLAATDTTPPTGSWVLYSYDVETQTVELRFAHSDPESGLDAIELYCDDASKAETYPYQAKLVLPIRTMSGGACTAYGTHWIWARARNGAGLWSPLKAWSTAVSPDIDIDLPVPGVTGQAFTIRPVYPSDWAPSPDAVCRWEFRWGSTTALRDNAFDETFGSLLFEGPAGSGYCSDWTFTLPWVPVRQYQVVLNVQGHSESLGFPDDGEPFITATVGSTDRHIRSSNLPLVYVLPDDYILTVGKPATYRLYTRGGITLRSTDTWSAFVTDSEHPFIQEGGSTFTFTPDAPGDWAVFWNGGAGRDYVIGAAYDPPARYPDLYRPDTTPPVQRIGGGAVGTRVPTTLAWSGSDRGWGINRYQLQRSVDGGTWRSIALPLPRSRSIVQWLLPGHAYRYRVRAIDNYGNVGYWDYGPAFSPRLVQESSALFTYRRTWTSRLDADASGGRVRDTRVAGASATITFTGRDVAWVAPRGPALGRALVYLDGRLVSTVDLATSVALDRRVVFRRHWSYLGTHTLRIVAEGTSGRPTVVLDAVTILR